MSEEQVEYITGNEPEKLYECSICGGKHSTLQQTRDCERECREYCRKKRLAQEESTIKDSDDYHQALVKIIKVIRGAEGVQLLKRLGHLEDARTLLYEKVKGVLGDVRGIEAQRMLVKDAEDELDKVRNNDW